MMAFRTRPLHNDARIMNGRRVKIGKQAPCPETNRDMEDTAALLAETTRTWQEDDDDDYVIRSNDSNNRSINRPSQQKEGKGWTGMGENNLKLGTI